MKKYIHINISTGNAGDSVLFSTDAGFTVHSFAKNVSILDIFCEICEVLENLVFTENGWAIASNIQQHFRHITCSSSNKVSNKDRQSA